MNTRQRVAENHASLKVGTNYLKRQTTFSEKYVGHRQLAKPNKLNDERQGEDIDDEGIAIFVSLRP